MAIAGRVFLRLRSAQAQDEQKQRQAKCQSPVTSTNFA
jgi:hypothetical protein